MKYLILALSLMVSAESAFAVPLGGNATGGGFSVYGTLADANNPVEMAVAPEYTRLAVVRGRTAKYLTKLTNDPATNVDVLRAVIVSAQMVQRLADDARLKLDAIAKTKVADDGFRAQLSEVRELILRAERMFDNMKGK